MTADLTLPASSFSAGGTLNDDNMFRLLLAITMEDSGFFNVTNFIGTINWTSTSTSYVDVTGATLINFNKSSYSPFSDVLVIAQWSAWRTTAGTSTTFGINDGTNDHDICKFLYTVGSEHMTGMGAVLITGLANGLYNFQLRAKGSAANAMTIDTNDTVSIFAMEVPN